MWIAVLLPWIANAQGKRLAVIRDAEIEALLSDYSAPIFKAAGIRPGEIQIHISMDDAFNAFVSGRHMVINTGAILQTEEPNELIGVIAHEAGHFIGGHQARLRQRVDSAQFLAVVGVLLGAGAAAMGGDAGSAAGQALLAGSQTMIMRDLLAYRRDEEIAADQEAIKLLDKTGQSAWGLVASFQRMDRQLIFTTMPRNSYLQTHPFPRERVKLLENLAASSKNFSQVDSANLQLRHKMAQAKILAYSDGIGGIQRKFRDHLTSAPARYGLAIAQFLQGKTAEALGGIDKLISEQPKNPYLYEMKAEILLRAGRAKEALIPMKKAVSLDTHKSGLMQIIEGTILFHTGDKASIREAIRLTKVGLVRDPDTIQGYSTLARAYAALGDETLALAASADEQFLASNFKQAKEYALRAQQKLKKNSPEWLRMQDIVLYKPEKN